MKPEIRERRDRLPTQPLDAHEKNRAVLLRVLIKCDMFSTCQWPQKNFQVHS
jgi:hypothetical protein